MLSVAPLLTLSLALLAGPALDPAVIDPTALSGWNLERVDLTRTGMWTLAGWGAASVVAGSAGLALTEDRRWRGFHVMTIGWGAVDLGLAAASLWAADPVAAASMGPAESLDAVLTLERVLLFNSGLDVGYLALGAWLWERGLRKDDGRLVGFGQAILLQGGFLLAFDLALYSVLADHGDVLRVMLLPGGVGVGGVF